jgi:hypothetical protein
MRKPCGKKLIKGKRVQQLMSESGLRDRLVIFKIMIMSYDFGVGLPLNLAIL